MQNIFKILEKQIRLLFLPLSINIPVRLPRGLAAGMQAKGALPLTNIFKAEDAEDLFLKSLDLKDKTIYDIGGFIGLVTLFFARQSGEGGQVYAFEPNPVLHKLITKNIKLNNLKNTEAFNLAVGDKEAEMTLEIAISHLATSKVKAETGQDDSEHRNVKIRVINMDDFISQNNLKKPHFMKIDVEGFEMQVLNGLQNTLKSSHPELFIEMHGHNNLEEFYNFLSTRGYSIFHIENNCNINSENLLKMQYGHIYCKIKK